MVSLVIWTSALIIGASAPALAQSPSQNTLSPPAACYEVVTTMAGANPFAPILVDRCTGLTWLLARVDISDSSGKPSGGFAYRWYPILSGSADKELVLTFPGTPKPARLEK